MRTVEDALAEKNNFDALRLFAAVGVIYSHAYPVVEGDHHSELLHALSGGLVDLGEICVFIFFLISGFLIAQSFARSRSLTEYFVNRVLRLVPALAVVTLVIMVIMGPLVTTVTQSEYWSSYSTYRYLGNAAIYPTAQVLPGVFETRVYPDITNASIWTLCYEFSCYLILAAVGLFLRKAWLAALALLAISLVSVFYTYIATYVFVEFASFFLVGGIIYLTRRFFVLDYRAFFFSVAMVVLAFAFNQYLLFTLCIFGSYAVIYIAFSPRVPLQNIARHGDFSYGVYLYAWPVQQLLLPYTDTQLQNFLFSLPIVLVLAALSWRLVEKPSLAQKKRVAAHADLRLGQLKTALRLSKRGSLPG